MAGRHRAVLLLCAALAGGQSPYDRPPESRPAVWLTVGRTAATPWRLEVDAAGHLIRVTHALLPALSFEVDADGPEDDQRYEGVTLLAGEVLFEGRLYGSTVPFFSTDHDAGRVERVRVEALDEQLRVRFEGGSYRNLSPAGPDAPVFFESVFSLDRQGRLTAFLNGLYYLFPSSGGSHVTLLSGFDEVSRDVPAQTTGYEYFEHVTRVEVEDPRYGHFRLEGLVERLQLHAHGVNADVFELDMDHAFKDRGQREVPLQFVLERPLAPGPR
jgi:hypothetical protein